METDLQRLGIFPVSMQDSRRNELLGASFRRAGVAVTYGHRVSPERLEAAKEICLRFFDLPLARRLLCERRDIGRQRGYTPMQVERAVGAKAADLKHFLHVGPTGVPGLPPNVACEDLPELLPLLELVHREMNLEARDAAEALAGDLGWPRNELVNELDGGNSVLRPIDYPDLSLFADVEGERAGAHEDINYFTMLPQYGQPGLQLLITPRMEWAEVNASKYPGAMILQAGDQLQLRTKGLYRSTTHRVVNLPGRRFSMPYFVHPRPDVVLHQESGYTSGEFAAYRFVQNRVMDGDLSMMRPPPVDFKVRAA